ncbi:VOC family protein [Paenibacillus sp. PR3]|uniref:Aldoketomutase n=1 Tax=Paenibacillus terricola TaxID=2763503 RepID=A0ABR8MYF3_9BACL|nr:VOC family protein [Paenibacillus terricola]MBD3920356.1 VOC family protein [Paenibacillus terricola]
MTSNETIKRGEFGLTFPVRLVSDVRKSQEWYRNVLQCHDISGYGHATRGDGGGMGLIVITAASSEDIHPNAVAQKHTDEPAEAASQEYGWDSLVEVAWDNLTYIIEEVRKRGGKITVEPYEYAHGGRLYKKAHIADYDGYNIVLSANRLQTEEPTSHQPEDKFIKTVQVRLVSDLKKSLDWYKHVLGCDEVTDSGYARRGDLEAPYPVMEVILQQAVSPQDVHPNAMSAKVRDVEGLWEGPDYPWDTFIHVSWEDVSLIVEEVRAKGGTIGMEPTESYNEGWVFLDALITDPDGYSIILGGMRRSEEA